MPRVMISARGVDLRASAAETSAWATRPGARWPNSRLAGHALRASFDASGLYDYAVGGRSDRDIPADEFNAFTSDMLRDRLPRDHPAYFVTVGQFDRAEHGR